MSKRVVILIHQEVAPGDSGEPLACVSNDPDQDGRWFSEFFRPEDKQKNHGYKREEMAYAIADTILALGLP